MTTETKKKNLYSDIDMFTGNEFEFREEVTGIHNDGDFIVATNGHILVEIDLKHWGTLLDFGKLIENFPDWKQVIPMINDTMLIDGLDWVDLFTAPSLLQEEPDIDEMTGEPFKFDLIKINGGFFQCKYMNVISTLFVRLGYSTGSMWIPRQNNHKAGAIFKQKGEGIRCFAMPVNITESIKNHNVLKEIEIY